jgi:uncharacterized membrane protein
MLTLLYPATVYYGMQYFQPREIALMLAVLLLLRLMVIQSRITLQIGLIGLVYAGFAAYSNQLIALRFYPVVVNTGMLLIFASSLIYPPCVIERLARLQNPVLPPQAPPYLFRLTQIWCGFFVINGSIALFTALYSSFEIWSLYNGLIAYLLMGLLFAGEYCVRQRIQKSGMWL